MATADDVDFDRTTNDLITLVTDSVDKLFQQVDTRLAAMSVDAERSQTQAAERIERSESGNEGQSDPIVDPVAIKSQPTPVKQKSKAKVSGAKSSASTSAAKAKSTGKSPSGNEQNIREKSGDDQQPSDMSALSGEGSTEEQLGHLVQREQRKYRDPQTGERVKIEKRVVVTNPDRKDIDSEWQFTKQTTKKSP